MRFLRLSSLMPLLLLLSGFPSQRSFYLSLVPECKAEVLANAADNVNFDTNGDLEHELLTLINRHRIQHGLQSLLADGALTQIARDHSHGMVRQGFISHDLPTGDLRTRMHRAGYSYEIARENVARARTVSIAQNLMVHSSKHKNNILAADVTCVGVGIARYGPPFDRYLYITEIFAAPRKNYSATSVQDLVLNRVNELQSQSVSASAQPDPLLENLAVRTVSSLEIPIQRKELQRLLADSAGELIEKGRTELSRLEVAVQLLRNPKNLRMPGQAGEKGAGMFGTAVRQVVDSKNQAAFLVLTLIAFTH